MDADAFRKALTAAAPSAAELLQSHKGLLSPRDAPALISGFQLDERPERVPNAITDAALHELFSKYDPSQVVIGMVRLAAEPIETAAGWTLGAVEADDLNLDRRSGEVVVTEFGTDGHTLWRCASNGEHFLAALAVVAPYLASCMTFTDNAIDVSNVHQECAASAGGDDYSDFYAMLLGLE